LNSFLHINKRLIFFIGVALISIFIIFIFSKQINLNKFEIKFSNENLSNIDILEPKFAINNLSKKINITANQGNFLNKDEVLLQNNVRFKSNDFSIETEKVIFNRNEQTAQSNSKSLFKSEKTVITSDGFDITDKGNKIIFYGNSLIILK
tara:strand:+ start:1486 stop:1935 length:450 start_codon:yes stop_codon:yes gene_type:complete